MHDVKAVGQVAREACLASSGSQGGRQADLGVLIEEARQGCREALSILCRWYSRQVQQASRPAGKP